jgi:hypothetical protein
MNTNNNPFPIDPSPEEVRTFNRIHAPKQIEKVNQLIKECFLDLNGNLELLDKLLNLFSDDQKIVISILIDQLKEKMRVEADKEVRKEFGEYLQLCLYNGRGN